MVDRSGFHVMAALAIMASIAAAGCSRTDNEPGPGGVTVSEAKALNDAAEMLESRDSVPPADAAIDGGADEGESRADD